MKVAVNPFVRRQTMASRFSSIAGDDFARAVRLIEASCLRNVVGTDQLKPGYRDGVLLVSVPPDGFYTGLIQLQKGDTLAGVFEPRADGEEPRKQIWANQPRTNKAPAVKVELVIYRRDVLAEDGSVSDETADWELVSINASPIDADVPIDPETLIANHYHLSGGTATNMSAEQFEAALRASVIFWRNWATLQP